MYCLTLKQYLYGGGDLSVLISQLSSCNIKTSLKAVIKHATSQTGFCVRGLLRVYLYCIALVPPHG